MDALYGDALPASPSGDTWTVRAVLAAGRTIHPTAAPTATSQHLLNGVRQDASQLLLSSPAR